MREQLPATEMAQCVVCHHAGARRVYTGLPYRKKPTAKTYTMLRCEGCSLLYVWPRPAPPELEAVYSDEEYRAEELTVREPRECYVEMDVWRRLQHSLAPGRVLDVGCGAGHFLHCARHFGWETYGVEIAPHSAEFARQAYGLSVLTTTVEALPFPRDWFDLITLIGVIEHVPDPVAILQTLQPFLKDSGTLFILTDNVRSWLHWLLRDRFPWLIPPEHLQLFAPQSMAALLQQTGFELLRVESKETIHADAAVRGLAALVGGGGRQAAVRPSLQTLARLLLWVSYPTRWFLWRLNLGAQIYVFARKVVCSRSHSDGKRQGADLASDNIH